jgi:trimethyllysine dioxygenase
MFSSQVVIRSSVGNNIYIYIFGFDSANVQMFVHGGVQFARRMAAPLRKPRHLAAALLRSSGVNTGAGLEVWEQLQWRTFASSPKEMQNGNGTKKKGESGDGEKRKKQRKKITTAEKYTVESVEVKPDKIMITFGDNRFFEFHNSWLRDHCQCPKCIDPSTKQRSFDTLDLLKSPNTVFETRLERKGPKGELSITWEVMGHVDAKETCVKTTYPTKWLRDNAYSFPTEVFDRRKALQGKRPTWTPATLKERYNNGLPEVEHADLMDTSNGDQGLKDLLTHLHRDGIVFVNNVPPSMEETERTVRRFGVPRHTPTWGTMWDTAPNSNPKDTAYTNIGLLPHVDCCYLEDQVGFQVFNCVSAAGEGGGASTWLDGFKVAEILKKEEEETFIFFSKTPLPYFCVTEDAHVQAEAPVFSLNHVGAVQRVKFNNYDRGPLNNLTFQEVREFYKLLPILYKAFRREDLMLKHTLKEGQMVIIDNWRVLHGREEFQGHRNLRGCYVGRDDVDSKCRMFGIL